jgi:very-short-patch-repair endonuclease
MTQRLNNARVLLARRHSLRGSLTPAEAVLWCALRGSGLGNRKFRRQQSIGPYIVDFYCAAEKLVIELDGSAHDHEQAALRDEARDRFLRSRGLAVIRLENRQVMQNLESVLAYISQHFKAS